MGERQRKPRTAAEEVTEEFRRAETEEIDGGRDKEHDAESGDALSTNVGAQQEAGADDRAAGRERRTG
ncbi:hypothetical protein [Streptomyces sp. Ru87]|uniref:hypothetical protein n=1 Tax=Streptomyces sp. Ru87 TaxID=2044307 RepID=UPI000BF9DD49|nr:hypothetical protein [Streptomyces sp. Ru87]PGH46710.1 hypothetical protein CRI70_32540 [Streptomyces sp. Ru87]